ncbi:MAG: Hsp20/alpha crystallin family protein [Planctomycetes bacterium]|nr:Hsp20/alpha crystallin family protein [Planctomycetota bacterium]
MAEKTIPDKNVPARSRAEELPATREAARYLAPAVDIYETEAGLTLVADMPGVMKDGLDIRVKDGVLTIVGEVGPAKRTDPSYQEYELASYFREFILSDEVDADKIGAELKHGVLTVQLPRAERAKPKKIEVRIV